MIKPAALLFPTPIWKIRAKNYIDINKGLMNQLTMMMISDNKVPAKLQKQWNSERLLFKRQFMKEINSEVLINARKILDSLSLKYNDIKITGAWANVNPPGTSHSPHTHPNNYLACAYYVSAPKGGNTINFLDPRPQIGLIRPQMKEYNALNAEAVSVDIEVGDLCFFPCWLKHSANKNISNKSRTSIAFNIMFTNYVNEMSSPMW